MAEKGIRLSKAAREVNLGIQHVAEFLSEKGFEVEAKPNTKLSSEMYEMLLDEFQADRKMKQESMSHTVAEPVGRETIAIKTAENKTAPVVEEKAETSTPEPTPTPTPTPVNPEPEVAAPAEPKVKIEEKAPEEKAPEEVQIKLYSVIYDAIEEVKDAMEGMLSAKITERNISPKTNHHIQDTPAASSSTTSLTTTAAATGAGGTYSTT